MRQQISKKILIYFFLLLILGTINNKFLSDLSFPKIVNKKKYAEVLKIATKAHNALQCRGVTRSDFKFYNDKFYLLEINTQPGMTSLSLVPEIANYKGLNFENLVEKILLDASINR